jgi:thiol-disulfide isomerase/thioredoxin
MDFAGRFAAGLPLEQFLAKYGSDEHRRRWGEVLRAVELSPAQRALLGGFTRELNVLVMAGAWCGDCVNQCPIFEHFVQASSKIQVRYIDRDADEELKKELSICGGARVPLIVFLSEEFLETGRYGDRTLSTYRRMVEELTGSACPTGLAAPEKSRLEAVVGEWLNEFERAQWMLRTSARLRQKHQD